MGGDRSGRYGFIEVCRVELRSEGEVWECEGWGDRSCMDGFTAVWGLKLRSGR